MSYDNDNSDANDVRDESMSQTTRRGLLGALGVAGLASLGSSSASANLSGGPEADAMAEYRVPTYRVPESELDTPGVVGREVTITSGGATYDTGDQLVDVGDRWELVSPNYGSLSAEVTDNTENAVVYAQGGSGKFRESYRVADYADATAAVHAARDALKSASGGKIKLGAYRYQLDGAVVIDDDGIMLEGTWPQENATTSVEFPQDNVQSVGGTVLEQTQAGARCLKYQHADDEAILFDVGARDMILTWSDSLQNSDTGDGIFATPAAGSVQRAIQGGTFENIRVYQHAGDAYGFNFENCQGLTTDQLRTEGAGGVLRIYSDGTAIGNSAHNYVYGMVDDMSGTADIYRIEGNVNFSRYGHLQYNTVDPNDGSRNSNGFVISPNGNLNDIYFGILDVEEFHGTTNGHVIGEMENMTSAGVGASNPLTNFHTKTNSHARVRSGDPKDFDAFTIINGTDPDPSGNKIWKRNVSGAQRFDKTEGRKGSPTELAASQGPSNFKNGDKIAWARGYLLTPETSFSAGTRVSFYSYWEQISDDQPTLNTQLLLDRESNLNEDLTSAVSIATRCNHSTNAGEMEIIVTPHKSTTARVNMVANLIKR